MQSRSSELVHTSSLCTKKFFLVKISPFQGEKGAMSRPCRDEKSLCIKSDFSLKNEKIVVFRHEKRDFVHRVGDL